jgi:predicted nucleotidyltransferase
MTDNPLITDIAHERLRYSQERLQDLESRLAKLPELSTIPTLTIFGAGSYARFEASEYSDIDLFFFSDGARDDVTEPRTKSLRLFGKVIDIIDAMQFPKFSNDCEYLVLLHTDDILRNLGSRTDDHENYFTARMLLILESKCLYGHERFEYVTSKIINSYFKDYPDHRDNFQPTFLLNDICRFWKTLLLNYENKRTLPPAEKDPERRRKYRVRNFKLKFSRLTTCFASVAALASASEPVTEQHVVDLTKLTPRERLWSVREIPALRTAVDDVLAQYGWFLEMTGLPTAELEACFKERDQSTEMFRKANEYGDAMFRLLQTIDASKPELRLLRMLVV